MKVNKVLLLFLGLIGSVTFALPANASCAFVRQDYRSRDNNRYNEGLLSSLKINDDFKLVSFVTTNKAVNQGETLTLKVPKPKQTTDQDQPIVPIVLVEEIEKGYKLDQITLSSENKNFYSFNWYNCVIKKSNVNINKLRFLARLPVSQIILLPVIFGDIGERYDFVFRASNPTVIKSFQIKSEEKVIYNTSNPSQVGEISLTWNGRDKAQNIVPAGLYYLFIDVEIRYINGSIEPYTEQISFYHNPNWLKQ